MTEQLGSRLALALLCAALLLCSCASPGQVLAQPEARPLPSATPQARKTQPPVSVYLQLRRSHPSVLTTRGPSPQIWGNPPPPEGVSQVFYPSGDLKLRAWLAMPKDAPAKVPAVVYFHGYFGFGKAEFANVQSFLSAGYAVLMPTLRGENGNPGAFELWYGEIDDARAAVRWLAGQPGIDAERIYTFGYSVGGGVSSLLSLLDDVPVRITASCGGLYPKGVFTAWAEFAPFDINDEREVQLRLLVGNMASMQRPHIAYLGEDEWLAQFAPAAETEAAACRAPLTVRLVPGDHDTALAPAIASFIETMDADRQSRNDR